MVVTPALVTTLSTRLKPEAAEPSAKRRLPEPTTTGNTSSRYWTSPASCRVCEAPAAVDLQFPAGPVFQRRHGIDSAGRDHGRVLPGRVGESGRNDMLRQSVQRRGDAVVRVGDFGPDGVHRVVGDALLHHGVEELRLLQREPQGVGGPSRASAPARTSHTALDVASVPGRRPRRTGCGRRRRSRP